MIFGKNDFWQNGRWFGRAIPYADGATLLNCLLKGMAHPNQLTLATRIYLIGICFGSFIIN